MDPIHAKKRKELSTNPRVLPASCRQRNPEGSSADETSAAPSWWNCPTRLRFMVSMHGIKVVAALSTNLGWFGVPPSGGLKGLHRLKPGLQAVRGFMAPILFLGSS